MNPALARISALRPNKTWIAFGMALAIGLGAALIARGYLHRQMEAIEARGKSGTQPLIVAKRPLRKGDPISRETIAVRDVPNDYAHSLAIGPEDFPRIAGRVLEHGMEHGDILLWSLLEGDKVPTFSARIEVGRRAITVHVDEINSISGLLEPGDAIDLMLTLDQKGRKATFPLLQNVQVMATGQRSVDDPASGERRQYSTVTLDTTQAQARSVIIAREAGKITALLRNPKDSGVVEGDSAALAALLGQAGDVQSLVQAAGAAQSSERAIPVLYGGRRIDFKPEELMLRQDTAHDADEGPLGAAATPTPGNPPAPASGPAPAPGRPAPQAALPPGHAPLAPTHLPSHPGALPR
jgi:pilus assembly protein CpaB